MAEGRAANGDIRWTCLCDCGSVHEVVGKNLRGGLSRSCGCAPSTRRGGQTRKRYTSPEAAAWKNMLHRCENPRNRYWSFYGGRGISVCPRWHNRALFLSDMGARPTDGHTLDRIDTNGNYEPENCRWATRAEQQANIRSNLRITIDGRTMHQNAWSRHLGIPQSTFRQRMGRWLAHAA